MHNLPAILLANGTSMALVIMLMLHFKPTFRRGLLDEILFFCMLWTCEIQATLETFGFLLDGVAGSGLHILSVVINTILFGGNIILAYFWVLYCDYKVFEDVSRLKRIYTWAAIPGLTVLAFLIVNLFIPLFFSIDANNVYHRGEYYSIIYIMTFLYLFSGVSIISHNKHKVTKYLMIPALRFILPIFLAAVLQYLLQGLSLLWVGVAIGLMGLYLSIQNEQRMIDNLSGLVTRQYLNNYLSNQRQHPVKNVQIAGILLDIDGFKSINDTYGHLTGDDAIATAGHLLLQVIPRTDLAARFAGDEFILILHIQQTEEVNQIIAAIHRAVDELNATHKKPFRLSFSMGSAFFNPSTDSVDSFIRQMDNAMYEQKREKMEQGSIPNR